jgi:hypothetical protein
MENRANRLLNASHEAFCEGICMFTDQQQADIHALDALNARTAQLPSAASSDDLKASPELISIMERQKKITQSLERLHAAITDRARLMMREAQTELKRINEQKRMGTSYHQYALPDAGMVFNYREK